ncbi:adenylyltransferase/cytidyltransferase family protein [Deinococcus lacus]|uniref:Adenylyltransferase/cytidyltransferase family protein n=1 Tax=Deinococcus lacus TaxID=392561 RepID=A0ABW1YAV6_9DEIO
MKQAAVYVGRFQPLHLAHLETALRALDHCPRLLLVLGSANLARSTKNPWSAAERRAMWRAALAGAGVPADRVTLRPLADHFDRERWAADLRTTVAAALTGQQPVLVGHAKDVSSEYLGWFPGWGRLALPLLGALNATDIRRAYFAGDLTPPQVPQAAWTELLALARRPAYARLQREAAALQAQQAQWDGQVRSEQRLLYAAQGQVWLCRRQGPVGEGLLELPGFSLPPGTPGTGTCFDHPGRSLGVPAVAWVSRVSLPPEGSRPFDLSLVAARPRLFFEDHAVLLQRLLFPQV